MKIKIILNVIFLCGLLTLTAFGQTSVYTIKVTPPTDLPPCKQRIEKVVKNGNTVTVFTAIIPNNLKLDFEGIRIGTEGNNYVFSFETDSGFCRTTAEGYEIEVSGATAPVVNPVVIAAPVPTDTDTGLPLPQEIAKAVEKAEEDGKEVDMSIPEAPGFTILGLTPQEVTRPTTPRELATTLINSVDRNGNFQTGIAIDTAPYQLFFGKRVNRDRDYIPPQLEKTIDKRKREPLKGYLTRFLWRTQFSLATTKGTTEDDKSARIGTGLNFTFLDFGDPNTDFRLRECQTNLAFTLADRAAQDLGFIDRNDPAIDTGDEFIKINARKRFLVTQDFILEQFDKCIDESEKRNFGKTSFGVGVAGSWISENGLSSKFVDNGQGLWASFAYGFEQFPGFRCTEQEITEGERCITPQLIFHFRRRVKETVPDPVTEGLFTTKDSNLFGARLRLGVPKWSVNFEGVYRGERYAGRTSSNNVELTLGADYRLAKDLYLNFSIGGATKESNIPNTGKVFVRTAFNWGTSQKPLN